jgi:hypothetical protein
MLADDVGQDGTRDNADSIRQLDGTHRSRSIEQRLGVVDPTLSRDGILDDHQVPRRCIGDEQERR